jgi:hypothetical protein
VECGSGDGLETTATTEKADIVRRVDEPEPQSTRPIIGSRLQWRVAHFSPSGGGNNAACELAGSALRPVSVIAIPDWKRPFAFCASTVEKKLQDDVGFRKLRSSSRRDAKGAGSSKETDDAGDGVRKSH